MLLGKNDAENRYMSSQVFEYLVFYLLDQLGRIGSCGLVRGGESLGVGVFHAISG